MARTIVRKESISPHVGDIDKEVGALFCETKFSNLESPFCISTPLYSFPLGFKVWGPEIFTPFTSLLFFLFSHLPRKRKNTDIFLPLSHESENVWHEKMDLDCNI